ncbi:hypothetical protein ABZ671_06435 [Micromonospora sp. NPDC006766]|uniref:hypothetical protein n=1 Tax=Micromonospora sp. NPDC006766 TaxID=3154778 RepID=UPI0033E9912C
MNITTSPALSIASAFSTWTWSGFVTGSSQGVVTTIVATASSAPTVANRWRASAVPPRPVEIRTAMTAVAENTPMPPTASQAAVVPPATSIRSNQRSTPSQPVAATAPAATPRGFALQIRITPPMASRIANWRMSRGQ